MGRHAYKIVQDLSAMRHRATCYCRRVQFGVVGDPISAQLNHSPRIQKLTGSPMQWTARFQEADVAFLEASTEFVRRFSIMTNNFLTSHILDATMGRSVMQCSHCGSWIGEEEPELEGCRDFLHVYVPLFNFPGEGTDRIPRAFQPRAQLGCMDEMLPSTDHLPRFFDLEDQDPRSPSDVLRLIAPPLDGRSHKGQGGRIGVLGGSVDFVGAPCYAGLSALRVGAELLYLFTADEATGPIKGFSPELMVSGVYSFARMDNAETAASEQDRMVERVAEFLPRLQALVIGPGLGRHPQVLTAVARIIKIVREMKIPLVLDADALYLVQQRPELVRRYPNVILTPNVRELALLTKAFLGREEKDLQGLADNMGSGIVLEKGPVDRIAVGGGDFILECREVGAPRRPGGLGDILAGAVAIIFAWQRQGSRVPASYACLAACTLLRKACEDAFARKKRSMVAPDVIEELGAAFEALCPAEAPQNSLPPPRVRISNERQPPCDYESD